MVICPACGEENPPKFRHCPYCGTPLSGAQGPSLFPPHEVRKTVTIVFSDLKGSTTLGEQLDSEALHEVKERYFSAMAAEITRHGGKVEKYIGDAIMAVFGLPRAHEDDALRAVRAVVGMQSTLERLNVDLRARYGVALANRTGVNTGEVVANDDPAADQKLATGDAVNVAARLEQAAPENQIYLGEVTYQLVRDAVEAEPVEPLELKGKAERVAAYRLVSVSGIEGNARRIDTPIVGRDAELAVVATAYREVCESGIVQLVTVIGDAGVGKSRLVHEVVERIAVGARVLRGRCLPYGDGITFWPLVGMVTQAAAIRGSDSPDEACNKLLALVGHADVTERLASATGLTTATFPLGEINWAARKFFEILAADTPLVAVIDDIHWAENAFLQLLEHVRDVAADAPILLLTTARHELLEEHPDWGTKPKESLLVLRPLDDAASAQVVANVLGSTQLPADVVARIVGAAEGNPLYVEQMLSMLIDSGALRIERESGRWVRADEGAEIAVPPTIHALLEARLDQLNREVRAAVEPASVIGLEFPQPAVETLMPDALRPAASQHLATLTRKQFIHPATAADADIVYRFHHHLVRDTVYGGLLKRARANLHIEFVRWADRVAADNARGLEIEEILGYHLEQAYRYLREFGPLDEKGLAIGADAARRLMNSARRAEARGDDHAAANLFQRAAAALPADDAQRIELLPQLGEALMRLGDFARARSVLQDAEAAADRISNQRIKASSQIVMMLVALYSGEAGDWGAEILKTANHLIPVLELESAHDELAMAWRAIVVAHGIGGRYGLMRTAAERSTAHARLAGNEWLVERNGAVLSMTALYGATPVPQAITECERLIAEGLRDRAVECGIVCSLAQLKAMIGEFDAARSLYRRGRSTLDDLGQGVFAASQAVHLATVELHAGDLVNAEREVRADYEFLARMGETYCLSTIAALLSRIVRDQGRDGEALALSEIAEGATSADDVDSQVLWRSIRAPIVARVGNAALAEELARSAVDMALQTEATTLQADALAELAAVLRLAGRGGEARHLIGEAIELYTAKGNVVLAERYRNWAGELDRS